MSIRWHFTFIKYHLRANPVRTAFKPKRQSLAPLLQGGWNIHIESFNVYGITCSLRLNTFQYQINHTAIINTWITKLAVGSWRDHYQTPLLQSDNSSVLLYQFRLVNTTASTSTEIAYVLVFDILIETLNRISDKGVLSVCEAILIHTRSFNCTTAS